MKKSDEYFERALRVATRAARRDEIPIGAVIVKNGHVIATGSNQTERRKSFLAHAELVAIQRASRVLRTKYLNDCDLYVTLEPCMMCRFAAKLCRIRKIYFLVRSQKFGRKGPAYRRTAARILKSPLAEKSSEALGMFFRSKRN